MLPLIVQLTIVEIAVLITGAIVLGLAIHFFIASQRSMKEVLHRSYDNFASKNPVAVQKKEAPKKQKETLQPEVAREKTVVRPKLATREESVDSLKETIMQQQKLLSGFLKQVEEVENEGKEELQLENRHLHQEIAELEEALAEKERELEETRNQATMADRMGARIDEVYGELEALQLKMMDLEKQASRANNLAMELEDTRQAYEQIHEDLKRRTEKFEEVFMENQRLQQELHLAEDKLAESNLQRQQLQKKVLFMQELNSDLQSVSDTNKKLQTELRRIGELESMLDMISEERDTLLRRQKK